MRFQLRSTARIFLFGAVVLPLPAIGGLSFDGTSQYVTFGTAKSLGSPVFTLETWFNWTGSGLPANTGSGGVVGIPLITKLSAEADGDARDGNYFLGIRPHDRVLVADMEEGATAASPGANHPVAGVTAVTPYIWHHAAVSYDGTNWVLFLDGHLETTLTVGQPPRSDSIQHAALAPSLNSKGAPQGYFAGLLDEARIWNYARSASQIASNRYVQIPSAPGLAGRWALDETSGLLAHDSSGHGVDGTLVNGPSWISNQRAATDVVTPIKLNPINPERTAALRQTEAQRMPPIFRFDPGVAGQVEKSFRTSFLLTRERFLAELEESIPAQQANSRASTSPRLEQLVTAFQNTNRGFPLDRPLARTWAQGRPDTQIQADLIAKLRETMTRYVCPDLLPPEAKLGPSNVRLYTRGFSSPAPDIDTVQAQSLSCSRTNLCALGQARGELRQSLSTNTYATANFMAGLVRETCLFDAELTRQSRARHVDSLFAADHYEPGQLIVRRGQIIDGSIRAALDELQKQTAADALKAQVAAEQIKAENALQDLKQRTAVSEFKSQHFSRQNRWLFGGLLVVAVTSSIAVWQLARPRRRQTLLPVAVRGHGAAGMLDSPPPDSAEGRETVEWKERALTAEKHAAQSASMIRAGVLPHLAHWLKHTIMKRLVTQRTHLLSTQEKAELELAGLEARLAGLHAPMEQRLQIYRQRIGELERELAAKGQESRELIEAKIRLTRAKLEAEQNPTPPVETS